MQERNVGGSVIERLVLVLGVELVCVAAIGRLKMAAMEHLEVEVIISAPCQIKVDLKFYWYIQMTLNTFITLYKSLIQFLMID